LASSNRRSARSGSNGSSSSVSGFHSLLRSGLKKSPPWTSTEIAAHCRRDYPGREIIKRAPRLPRQKGPAGQAVKVNPAR